MTALSLSMEPIQVLSEDLILVDWGPMTLTVSTWLAGKARPVMATRAARTALACLEALSDFQGFMKSRRPRVPNPDALPEPVRLAWEAVRRTNESLTPMAAVAGAVADTVAEAAVRLGADRVIVNNGGDIALRLTSDEQVTVGLRPPESTRLAGRLRVDGASGIGGVASSAWRGRSLSPGVADLVTVWAESAALADAAATLIAGSTLFTTPGAANGIVRVFASDMEPDSDLKQTEITRHVNRILPAQVREAMAAGMSTAHRLFDAGIIMGCLIRVQTETARLDPNGTLHLTSG